MRHHRWVIACATFGLLTNSAAAPAAKPAPKTFTYEQAKTYFEVQKELYPEKGDQFRKLVETFGDTGPYSTDQLTAITNPKTTVPMIYVKPSGRDKDPVRGDTYSPEKVRSHFALVERRDPSVGNLWKALLDKYGPQPWYLATEVRDVEENGDKPKTVSSVRPLGDPVRKLLDDAEDRREKPWPHDFKSPRIRQSWRDVLGDEDPQPAGQWSRPRRSRGRDHCLQPRRQRRQRHLDSHRRSDRSVGP